MNPTRSYYRKTIWQKKKAEVFLLLKTIQIVGEGLGQMTQKESPWNWFLSCYVVHCLWKCSTPSEAATLRETRLKRFSV